jgi:hypothetical protein
METCNIENKLELGCMQVQEHSAHHHHHAASPCRSTVRITVIMLLALGD